MTADDAGSAPEAKAAFPSDPAEPASLPESPSLFRRGRLAFRYWRRSRPFWGGLLMILGGLELLALPLSGVLIKGAIKFVIYIGIGGVFGVLIGALLITAGLVVWFNPTHRVFYGVAGIVLGLLSFPASNLGGFLLGMLLAIFGGAAAIAWTPLSAQPAPGPASARSAEPLPPVSAPPQDAPQDTTRAAPRNGASGQRLLAITAMPVLILAGMLTSNVARTASSSGGDCALGILCLPGETPAPSQKCLLGVICLPAGDSSPAPDPATSDPATSNPSPSNPATLDPAAASPAATASASPRPSARSTASPTASPTVSPTVSGQPGNGKPGNGKPAKHANGSKKASVKNVAAPSGLEASAATSVLTANAATLNDFQFVGIANLPVAGAGAEKTLEFTASSATLTGNVNVAVTQNGVTTNTSSPDLDFSGMTLYSTELCGDIYGITGRVCFTPSTVDQVLLQIASVLTGVAPLSMTDVTTYQPVTIAGALQTGTLSLG